LCDKFGDLIEWANLSDGEITVLPHRDKLLDLFLEKHWGCTILTNALRYNEKVAELVKRGESYLNISLDSGTVETYHKVKGVNAFDVVVQNIEKYAEKHARIELKYILLPGLNDSYEDINGFIEICTRIHVYRVVFSNDVGNLANLPGKPNRESNIPESQFAMYAYFSARCKENGLNAVYVADCFTPLDCLRMNLLCDPI
jgi:MoaA/NifB/PqqE/SkfB family radical SAM enzyme